MMDSGESARADWVSRVLGVAAAPAVGSPDLAALERSLLAAVKITPDDRTVLMAAWQDVSTRAEDGHLAATDRVLGDLRRRIDAILAAPARTQAAALDVPEGLVAARRAELEAFLAQRIAAAKGEVDDEIGKLSRPLDDVIEDPEQLVQLIQTQLAAMLDALWPALEPALVCSPADAAQVVGAWQAGISTDPRIVQLRETAGLLGSMLDIDGAIAGVTNDANARIAALA